MKVSGMLTKKRATFVLPASTIAALKLLSGLDGRRVAILGDMLDLGQYEIPGHQAVGEFSAKSADLLILVGQRSRIIRDTAKEYGFPEENIYWFENSDQAAQAAVGIVQKGDVVLIKGSNSMRMGRIIEKLKERV